MPKQAFHPLLQEIKQDVELHSTHYCCVLIESRIICEGIHAVVMLFLSGVKFDQAHLIELHAGCHFGRQFTIQACPRVIAPFLLGSTFVLSTASTAQLDNEDLLRLCCQAAGEVRQKERAVWGPQIRRGRWTWRSRAFY